MASQSCERLFVNQDYFQLQILRELDPAAESFENNIKNPPIYGLISLEFQQIPSPIPDPSPAHTAYTCHEHLPCPLSPILSTTRPLALFLPHTAQRQGRTFLQQINRALVTKPRRALNTILCHTNKLQHKSKPGGRTKQTELNNPETHTH